MICPKCGKETEGKFCPGCGEKLCPPEDAVPAPQPAADALPSAAPPPSPDGSIPPRAPAADALPSAAPPPAPTGGIPPRAPVIGANGGPCGFPPAGALNGETPARQLYRKLATSPAYLIAVIAFTVSLILSMISVFGSVSAMDFQSVQGSGRSVPPEAAQALHVFVWVLCGLVYGAYALAVGAFWQIWLNARGQGPLRTAGLTIIKVLLIVCLVLICLLLALVLFISVAGAISGDLNNASIEWSRGFSGQSFGQGTIRTEIPNYAAGAMLAVVMILMVLIAGLLVLFLAKALKTVNVVKRVVLSGAPDDRVSMLVMGFCILSALGSVTNLVSLITGGRMAELYAQTGVSVLPSAIGGAAGIAMQICFALLLWRWREGMRALGVYKGVFYPVSRPY